MKDWEMALQETVAEFRDRHLGYGQADCCQFVRRYVERVTGKDPAPDYGYATSEEAARILDHHGGVSGLIRVILGEPHDPEPGDVVVVHVKNEQSAGVLADDFVDLWLPEHGFARVSARAVIEAWPCHR